MKPDLSDVQTRWVCMTEKTFRHIVMTLTALHSPGDMKALVELKRAWRPEDERAA